jgi:hypothetical protein
VRRLEFESGRPSSRKAFCVGCNCAIDGNRSIYCGLCASKSRGSKGGDSLIRKASMETILLMLGGSVGKSGRSRGRAIPLHVPLLPPGPHRAHIEFMYRRNRELLAPNILRWHEEHVSPKPRKKRPKPTQRPPERRPTQDGPQTWAAL